MTDIVERLRHEVEVFYGKPPCSLLNEAADEIERLRGWLINLRGDVLNVSYVCNRLSDQIGEVLGEENDD